MLRLIDRNRPIPYGFKFKLPEANWEPPKQASFTMIVNGAMAVAAANPHLAKQSKWPTSREDWENKVDYYNAAICKAHGWNGFYIETGGGWEGAPVPNSLSPLQFAGRAVAGANVLLEMFGKEGPIRDRELANRRARTCVDCPKNDSGDLTRIFTKPAQALVIKALGMIKDLNLHTDYDDRLEICSACGCPMKGKVWAPLQRILNHMPKEDYDSLHERCWIRLEEASIDITHQDRLPSSGDN